MKDVYVIVGPTASGKTKLAIELANKYNGEIINGDAFQVYREINIGTAKPTAEELKQAPHHLINYKSITDSYDVVTWLKDCEQLIKKLHQENKPAIVVGGSNLYINSLIYKYDFSQKPDDIDLSSIDDETLHNELKGYDEEIAKIIHPNNRRRVESYVKSFRSGTQKERRNNEKRTDYNFIIKSTADNYSRDELYNRINQRVDLMMEKGLLDEVTIINSEYDLKNLRSLQAIGYKEWVDYFNGNASIESTVEQIKKASRNYAKKQLTWIRKWYEGDGE